MTPTTQPLEEPTTALAGAPTWTALDIPPVTTPEDEQNITDYMNMSKAFQTQVRDFFRPHKDRAYAAHRGLCADESRVLQPAIDTEAMCKRALVEYRRQLEDQARQERERLEALARKEETARRAREIEALRAQAETTTDQSEAMESLAEAQALEETPVHTPAVYVPAPPKATGAGYRDKFYGDMTDKLKLLAAVVQQGAAHPEYLALFDFNESAARKLAEMVKTDGKEILPGLVCVRDINVSGRRR